MIPVGEPEIKRDDSTPSIVDQGASKGWDVGFYDFGLGEQHGVDYFNAGICERPDGLWLLVRRSEQEAIFGINNVWAFMLDEAGKVPKMGKKLLFTQQDPRQQFEDARGFYDPKLDQVHISCCSFVWYGEEGWSGAIQVFGSFNSDWELKQMSYPLFGNNAQRMERVKDVKNYEKNWTFFHNQDGKLMLLYKPKPWVIAEFGETWEDVNQFTHDKGVTWKWGELRGGTPPVIAPGPDGKDLYWTFPHSSLQWRGAYRRYYFTAVAFETKPPYKPLYIVSEPLLMGSQNDPKWVQRKPVCVFPCGALYNKGMWQITGGSNDLKAFYCFIPHESLLKLIEPINKTVTPIFSVNGLSEGELKKEKMRANAARARAALAAKRAKLKSKA